MQRVSVVGNSGAGKSTLAVALAEVLDAPYVELDALYHRPGWVPIDPDAFLHEAARIAAGDRWVVDGNYRRVVLEGPIWARADTVVWVRPPRRAVMAQLAVRTLRRLIDRRPLWNGNRERPRQLLRWAPEENILRWAWTQHDKYERRFGDARHDPRYAHLRFVELRSRAEVRLWLDGIAQAERITHAERAERDGTGPAEVS